MLAAVLSFPRFVHNHIDPLRLLLCAIFSPTSLDIEATAHRLQHSFRLFPQFRFQLSLAIQQPPSLISESSQQDFLNSTMPPKPTKVHLVRHAQAFHNLGVQFHTLQDPNLTPLGIKQCAELRDQLGPDFHSRINLVTASPLSRTLQTAFIVCQPALQHKATEGVTPATPSLPDGDKHRPTPVPTAATTVSGVWSCNPEILAMPDLQEISSYPCDCGSSPSVLSNTITTNSWPVNTSLIHEGWNHKSLTNRWSPKLKHINCRARAARRLLKREAKRLRDEKGLAEPEIVVVSHGGLLHFLTADWEDASTTMGTGWRNCEIRSFTFLDETPNDKEEEDEAYLIETDESRRSRGKTTSAHVPGGTEQENLFWETMTAWQAQGLETPVNIGEQQEHKLRLAEDQDAKSDVAGPDAGIQAVPIVNGTAAGMSEAMDDDRKRARLEPEDDMPEVSKSLSHGVRVAG